MNGNTPKKKKILIIDSDPLLAELIHFHFSSIVEIDRISSFDELLSCDFEDYNLVILDPRIDNNSGREIVDILRGTPGADIPIILTAYPKDQEAVVKCLAAGATDYISRPFEVSLLVSRISRFVGGNA